MAKRLLDIAGDDTPMTMGAMKALLEPILSKIMSIDERQARLEWVLSNSTSSMTKGLIASSNGGRHPFPDRLRAAIESTKFSVDQHVEVEYKVPTVKLGSPKPGEIPRKRGNWYPGIIIADRGDNTYDVEYFDGEREIRITSNLIRPKAGEFVSSPTASASGARSTPKSAAGQRSSGSSSLSKSKEFSFDPIEPTGHAGEVERAEGGPAASPDHADLFPSSNTGTGDEDYAEEFDEEMVPGGGDEAGCVKPWLGAVKPPKCPPAIDPEAPSQTLQLSWVHGYTAGRHGKHIVSKNLFYNADGEIIFPAAALGIKISQHSDSLSQSYFKGHDDDILCLAVSPCRKFVATGQIASNTPAGLSKARKGKGSISIWAAVTMAHIAEIAGCHQRGVTSLSFSTDSTKLLSIGLDDDSTHKIYGTSDDWRTPSLIAEAKGEKSAFLSACWVRPESSCASVGKTAFNIVSISEKATHLWNLAGNKLERQKASISKKLDPAGKVVLRCAANFRTRDGWKVAMGGSDGAIYLFSSKEADGSIPGAHSKEVLTMTEAGSYLVTGGADKAVKVWGSDLKLISEYSMTAFSQVDATIGAIDVRADCSRVICGLYGGEVVEIATKKSPQGPLDLNGASARVLQYSHSKGELWGLACHPVNTDLVATVGDDSILRVWSISKNKMLSATPIGWPGRSLSWHPSGDAIAIGLYERVKGGVEKKGAAKKGKDGSGGISTAGSVLVFSVAVVGEQCVLEQVASGCPSMAWIGEVRFSPSGNLIGVGSHDKKLYVYRVDSNHWSETFNKDKYVLNKHSSSVVHMDFSADELFLQTTCQAGELLFSNCETGKQETSATKMAEYHGTDGVAEKRYWSTMTSTLGWGVLGIWPPGADGSDINACDRSCDEELLATGDDFGQLKLFRYPVAQESSRFTAYTGHSSHVTNVRFTADASHVVSVGGNDQCLFVWKVAR